MKTTQPIAIIIMGVSGSGKTTIGELLSSKTNIPFADGDSFHPQKNIDKMVAGHPLNDQDRLGWLQEINKFCTKNIKQGKSCIVACSALKQSYRAILQNGIKEQMVFVYLLGTFELIQERLGKRKSHFMPASLLKSQFEALQPPKDAITMDIDNTPTAIVEKIVEQLP
ncbi:gluconokinase [Galbibacter pacificus]|uniref:Gluconokinase n=1 Tax=Galbibacter pacificus TaxID=2996052 RepID=A0ABT6FPK7_9FLAO|nr:gluconokinase [Galbibacter pacificus]MDG3582336.1 gluconokinase [Galbibacter pacificus]MDG3585188.1 gluconokinase [Galbibacter pacificus]